MKEGTDINTIADFLREVQTGNENVIDIARNVTDGQESVRMTLGRRTMQPEPPLAPKRAESPARRHQFNDPVGFLEYLKCHGAADGGRLVVLGDPSTLQIAAVLDDRATQGFEVVTMVSQLHPLFKPWATQIIGKSVEADAFAQFVMANRRAVTEPDGREVALLMRQLTLSAAITIQKGQGPKSINGVMCKIDIQGAKQDVPMDLPETLTLHVPLLVGTQPRDVVIDLLVTADPRQDEEIIITATSAGMNEALYEAFEAMLAGLGSGLYAANKNAIVSTGKPDHAEWKYLR